MISKPTEKGQALVIIALAAVVLFGFAALAIDGSMVFSDRRHAQNAADTAAMAGALAFTRGNDITLAAEGRATDNDYDDNGTTKIVTVTITDVPNCPGKAPGKDIEVEITSVVNTTFARVLGTTQFTNVVRATARGCGYIVSPLFSGNAIVSLNPTTNINNCAFDSGDSNSAKWIIEGGGIFSNGCAISKNNDSVTLDPGECITSVSGASGFTCQQTDSSQAVNYPADALAMMPPNPCDGTPGDVGLPQGSGSTFSNGVYCISDMDALDNKNVVLNNATLYVTDTKFNLKFAGGGGFYGDATTEGTYSYYYMIIAIANPPCTDFTSQNSQVIVFRGESAGTFTGTILAPSACLDLRGNGQSSGVFNSQLIGYSVSSNGTADIYINYNEEENHKNPYEPSVSLRK